MPAGSMRFVCKHGEECQQMPPLSTTTPFFGSFFLVPSAILAKFLSCGREETSEREMIHELNLLSTISHPRILGLIGAGFERTRAAAVLLGLMARVEASNIMVNWRRPFTR